MLRSTEGSASEVSRLGANIPPSPSTSAAVSVAPRAGPGSGDVRSIGTISQSSRESIEPSSISSACLAALRREWRAYA